MTLPAGATVCDCLNHIPAHRKKEKPSESTMFVPHTVQRAPHAANPPLISPSGVKWQTPGYQLFSPVPQMVTQRGANKWMTSCPRGWHQWQQIQGGEEVRGRGSDGRRGEKTLQSQDGQTKHSTLLQLKGAKCSNPAHCTKALLVIYVESFKVSFRHLQQCWEINSFVKISTDSLKLMLIFMNGWEGGGWWRWGLCGGLCCVLLSQSNPSCQSVSYSSHVRLWD